MRIPPVVTLLISVMSWPIFAQTSTTIITTVAGNGTAGFGGDGGPATGVALFHPTGGALDSKGNLYIADLANNRVLKVSNGVDATVAGTGTAGFSGDGGPAIGAALSYPAGVAVDPAGTVYISDTSN